MCTCILVKSSKVGDKENKWDNDKNEEVSNSIVYDKKVKTVMVNNYTNINKTKES